MLNCMEWSSYHEYVQNPDLTHSSRFNPFLPFRFRLFRKEVQAVVASNKDNVEWKAGLNFFADLTQEVCQLDTS